MRQNCARQSLRWGRSERRGAARCIESLYSCVYIEWASGLAGRGRWSPLLPGKSKLRQKCVKSARNTFGGETPFGRYRILTFPTESPRDLFLTSLGGFPRRLPRRLPPWLSGPGPVLNPLTDWRVRKAMCDFWDARTLRQRLGSDFRRTDFSRIFIFLGRRIFSRIFF